MLHENKGPKKSKNRGPGFRFGFIWEFFGASFGALCYVVLAGNLSRH